jgi:autotransporter-associated beta strand protein
MKTSYSAKRLISTLLLAAAGVAAYAADIVKTNNADALNLGSSWVGGLVPTAGDLMIFDSTLDGSFSSYAIGGNLTNNGISFRDAATAQTITATASSMLTLANGSPGIDMTAAAIANLTISCPINLGSAGGQIFNMENSDRLLLVNAVISGAGPLTKTGAGLFRSSNNAHTYTGGTIVSEGTLQLGVNNALAAGPVTVQSGATLDLNTLALTGKPGYVIRIAGTGVGGNGALVHNGAAQLNIGLTNLVLDANASVGGVGRFDMRPISGGFPFIDLAGNTLTKVGGNVFFLQELSAITDGNIFIQAGILGLNGVPLTGNGLVTVGDWRRVAHLPQCRGDFNFHGDASDGAASRERWYPIPGWQRRDAIEQSVGSPITLTGDATINGTVAGAVFELAGPISGGFGLTKTGPGTLLLSGASTYSGDHARQCGEVSPWARLGVAREP